MKIFCILLLISASLLSSCSDSTRSNDIFELYASTVEDTKTLIEQSEPFSLDDPELIKYKETHPEVIGLLIVADKKNRITLFKDESESEYLNEMKNPIEGELRFSNGKKKLFYELRLNCEYGGEPTEIRLRIDRANQSAHTTPTSAPR